MFPRQASNAWAPLRTVVFEGLPAHLFWLNNHLFFSKASHLGGFFWTQNKSSPVVEGGCVVITPQASAEKTSFCLSAERPAEAFSRHVPVRTWSPWVGVFSFTFPAVCSLQISFKPIISCNLDHFLLGFPTPILLFSCQSSWLSLSFTGKRKTLLFWGDPTEELRVGLDWATSLSLFTFMHWRRKWQPTPVFLLGESQDGEAWWAAVYGVAQSRTRLKRLSSSSREASLDLSHSGVCSMNLKITLPCEKFQPMLGN